MTFQWPVALVGLAVVPLLVALYVWRERPRAFLDEIPAKYRVAIVGFSGRAYVALPPTDDRTLARTALRSLHTAEGTSLGEAIALSTQLARRQRAGDGTTPPATILVISDGAQLSG